MRRRLEDEIVAVRAGVKGEGDAYEINLAYRDRESVMVIHDLRLEYYGRVAPSSGGRRLVEASGSGPR